MRANGSKPNDTPSKTYVTNARIDFPDVYYSPWALSFTTPTVVDFLCLFTLPRVLLLTGRQRLQLLLPLQVKNKMMCGPLERGRSPPLAPPLPRPSVASTSPGGPRGTHARALLG
ncbi:unnamed protein product, partial [Ectocarpus fasciculatus]